MRGIAIALKHQKFRKRFPEGVSMCVHQTGAHDWVLRATCMKKNETVDVMKHTQSEYGIMLLTQEMWSIADGLRAAGVKVITSR